MPDPANSNVKQTPGRRRPGPNAVRTAPKKSYASENDASTTDPNFQPDFAPRNRGPRTPQKRGAKSPAPNSLPVSGKSSRRGGNKNCPKNITTTSPAPTRQSRHTPPHTAGPKAASTAFAGATFHASPAPSSLPLPSFFTKTNSPDTPHARTASTLSGQQPSPPASDSELVSTAARRVPHPAIPAAHQSPLDIFFRADRAEKEHARRASSANIMQTPIGHFSPPGQAATLYENGSNTFPKGPASHQAVRRPVITKNLPGISVEELDGNPHQPIGPAFATPFHERIRAVRPADGRGPPTATPGTFRDLASPSVSSPSAPQAQSADDRSEALKRFLFSKTSNAPLPGPGPGSGPGLGHSNAAPPAPVTSSQRFPEATTASVPNGSIAAAYQNIYATPSAAATSRSNGGQSNYTAMETSLRRILKLDSPFNAGGAPPPYTRAP